MCVLTGSEVMVRAFLGIGSNLGDREAFLVQALHDLSEDDGIFIKQVSSIYETESWGMENQPQFLNQVVEIDTIYKPHELLSVTQQIENHVHRQRVQNWGPRTLDIDLLIYGDQQISDSDLHIPHQFLHARRFVLEPLVEIDPSVWVPKWNMTAQDLLAQCKDQKAVTSYRPRTSDSR